jgi:putative flippase GtrA
MTTRLVRLFNHELFRYGVAGATTTAVNLLVYHALLFLGVPYMIANIFAIVLSKVYAYFVNKLYVFRVRSESAGEAAREVVRFVFARGFTGLVDYFGLIALVELFGFSEIYSKYAVVIAVIVLNYILGKKMVFVKEENKGE